MTGSREMTGSGEITGSREMARSRDIDPIFTILKTERNLKGEEWRIDVDAGLVF